MRGCGRGLSQRLRGRTGIVGETCGGTTDCMCGLFCNAGICSPYEGQYENCTCEGEVPDFGGDPTPTCADLEEVTG